MWKTRLINNGNMIFMPPQEWDHCSLYRPYKPSVTRYQLHTKWLSGFYCYFRSSIQSPRGRLFHLSCIRSSNTIVITIIWGHIPLACWRSSKFRSCVRAHLASPNPVWRWKCLSRTTWHDAIGVKSCEHKNCTVKNKESHSQLSAPVVDLTIERTGATVRGSVLNRRKDHGDLNSEPLFREWRGMRG